MNLADIVRADRKSTCVIGGGVRADFSSWGHRIRLATLLAALLAGCGDAPAAPPPPEPASHDVAYLLSWDDASITRHTDGWSTTNDVGTTITVHRGWWVSFSADLVACDPSASLWDRLVPDAFAGHSTTIGPATVSAPVVESLTAMQSTELGRVHLDANTFCQAHYLAARAPNDVKQPPTDVDMIGATLFIEGTYGPAGTPFTIRNDMAHGRLIATQVDTSFADRTVELRRDPARMFDGVDFAGATELQLAWRVLWNVVEGATVVVR